VTAPAETYWIITPSEILALYPSLETAASYSLLEELCAGATSEIESISRRHFVQRTAWAETHPGSEDCYLRLKNPPVNSIATVEINDETLTTVDWQIVDADTGLLYRSGGWGVPPYRSWPQGAGLLTPAYESDWALIEGQTETVITVTYNGGYTRANVPSVAKRAARLYVMEQVNTEKASGYDSERIGEYGYQITRRQAFATGATPDPEWVRLAKQLIVDYSTQ
jgi:hypothetical protein